MDHQNPEFLKKLPVFLLLQNKQGMGCNSQFTHGERAFEKVP